LAAACGAALLLMGLPAAHAATANVSVVDNSFIPSELHVDPGDTVVWENKGFQNHTVSSEDKLFDSGFLSRGEKFSRTFNKEGFFFYFCKLHGAAGGIGMSGVVVVGDPPDPSKDERDVLVVPDDYRSIQKAVDAANSGSKIVVKPGRYSGGVVVSTPGLLIRGGDRFRTVLDGGDVRENGILIAAPGVVVKDMTVRNYTGAGILIDQTSDYTVNRVDLIKNRTFGVHAMGAEDGVIKNSFAWGSGDSGVRISDCYGCSSLVRNVKARTNFIGILAANATGVVVRSSTAVNNGAGIVIASFPEGTSSRAGLVTENVVAGNNYGTVPAAGLSETMGIPIGTGVWVLGAANATIYNNRVTAHQRYGVLVTASPDGAIVPRNSAVTMNEVGESSLFDLAWDGTGNDNCFSGNVTGPTGPGDLQETYGCEDVPFAGTPYQPVIDEVSASYDDHLTREQVEPPEPNRPRCQRGRPGCR